MDLTLQCEWEPTDPDFGTWETSCGHSFFVVEGSPSDNDMRFCCYCGHPLKEIQ